MKVNAAIIGTGIGLKHLEAIDNFKNSNVKIICEKNKKKHNKLKKMFPNKKIVKDSEKIFSDKSINLVSIASYDNYHYSQILKCIKSNKHIIVEKPMCLKKSELIKIFKLIKKNKKIKIVSNLPLRTNSLFNYVKEKITLKKIFYIEADYIWGRVHKLYQWRSKVKNYSIVLGAGIHMIDLVMWILKSRPLSVYSYGNDLLTKKSKFKKKSFVICILRFPNNILVKITANSTGAYNHMHEIKVFQKDKTFVNSILGSFNFIKRGKKTEIKKINAKYPDKNSRKKLIHNFIDVIKSHKKPFITLKEQIDLMTVCFAANKSLKQNKEIRIQYL